MALHEEEAQARSELLLRDAEEDLARERLHNFWRNWGSTVIGMCLMLVIGTGAGVAWRHWRDARDARSTDHLITIVSGPAVPMTQQAAEKMTDTHAAIGWLTRAGVMRLDGTPTPEQIKELQTDYEEAARKGGDTAWGWLARWNSLRLRMDDPGADPKDLIGKFDDLADAMGSSPLAALPQTDAAILAGERLKDPKLALEYLERAEKSAGDATQMTVHIADLRHLYQIRERKDGAGTTTEEKTQ